MKRIIYICSLLFSLSVFSQEQINWIPIDSVEFYQKNEKRPVFVDVYAVWCGPCKNLDKFTFRDPDVIEYINQNYYAVKFDAESKNIFDFNGKTYSRPGRYHQFTSYLQLRGFPTLSFMDSDYKIIHTAVGYYEADKLLEILKSVAKK